jgi:hypothetical protein
VSARYSQENNPKRTSKNRPAERQIQQGGFLLVLFVFPPGDMKESQVENSFLLKIILPDSRCGN